MSSSLKCLSVPIEIRFSIEFVDQMDIFVLHTKGTVWLTKNTPKKKIVYDLMLFNSLERQIVQSLWNE